jgi:hypothetical protein
MASGVNREVVALDIVLEYFRVKYDRPGITDSTNLGFFGLNQRPTQRSFYFKDISEALKGKGCRFQRMTREKLADEKIATVGALASVVAKDITCG